MKGYSLFAARLGRYKAWVAGVIVSIVIVDLIGWRIFMETHGRSRAVQEQFGDLTARVIENLNGIRVVKAYATEEIEIERFEELSDVQVSLSLRLARIQAVFFPVFTIVLET